MELEIIIRDLVAELDAPVYSEFAAEAGIAPADPLSPMAVVLSNPMAQQHHLRRHYLSLPAALPELGS